MFDHDQVGLVDLDEYPVDFGRLTVGRLTLGNELEK